jgi:hypothetical protein
MMIEIFQNFEQIAIRCSPSVLIGLGLGAVLVGLFVWLGGLGFRKLLIAVAGAVSGGICGFFIVGRNIMPAIILASLGAVIAIIFERVFVTILLAVLVAVFSFAFLARPYVEISEEAIPTNQSPALSVGESVQLMKTYIVDVSDRIKRACSQMPVHNWVIILILAVAFIVVGFYLERLASALCYSTLGTMLIFAGMILLLLYKGSAPISGIDSRPLFYGGVFVAMAAFGTIEQLLVCQPAKRHGTRKKEASKQDEKSEGTKRRWRTS